MCRSPDSFSFALDGISANFPDTIYFHNRERIQKTGVALQTLRHSAQNIVFPRGILDYPHKLEQSTVWQSLQGINGYLTYLLR